MEANQIRAGQMNNSAVGGIREKITLCKNKLDDLARKKRAAETDLSRITLKIRTGGRLPQLHYTRLCNDQHRLKREILDVEDTIIPIKRELRKLSDEQTENFDQLKSHCNAEAMPQVVFILSRLREMRNEYLAFAEDLTRVSSMRQMAAQFSRELTELIGQIDAHCK